MKVGYEICDIRYEIQDTIRYDRDRSFLIQSGRAGRGRNEWYYRISGRSIRSLQHEAKVQVGGKDVETWNIWRLIETSERGMENVSGCRYVRRLYLSVR